MQLHFARPSSLPRRPSGCEARLWACPQRVRVSKFRLMWSDRGGARGSPPRSSLKHAVRMQNCDTDRGLNPKEWGRWRKPHEAGWTRGHCGAWWAALVSQWLVWQQCNLNCCPIWRTTCLSAKTSFRSLLKLWRCSVYAQFSQSCYSDATPSSWRQDVFHPCVYPIVVNMISQLNSTWPKILLVKRQSRYEW